MNDEVIPIAIVVFCDACGEEHEGQYLVRESDSAAIRLGYARTHLVTLGWTITQDSDLCSSCSDRPVTGGEFRARVLGALTDLGADRGHDVTEWPADEAAAYRDQRFEAGREAVRAVRLSKAADALTPLFADVWDSAIKTMFSDDGETYAFDLPNPFRTP